MAKTKTQLIVEALVKRGATEVTSTSRKYRRFVWHDKTLWVGTHGALREGRTISDSWAWPEHFIARLSPELAAAYGKSRGLK